jgi:sugar O-acyltransferase (sialic acid O-acetyltransferase NeuD family)
MSNSVNEGKLIIVGDRAFAEIAFEYFSHDSPYDVVAFSVEREFITRDGLFGLPVVPFEDLENEYDPQEHKIFIALTYARLNRVRTRLFQTAKAKGYKPASYVSSRAFVWNNVEIGQNCFIFENNVVQPYVRIGDNCILWSGNHIGHHSTINANCFVSSHVVISGCVEIGENCFLGVNSTIVNNVKVASDNVVGAGALILKDTAENTVHKGTPASISETRGTDTFTPGGGRS